MANIQRYLELIKSAIYGREVRDSICDAIEAIDEEVSDAHVEMSEFVQGNMDDTLTSTTLPAQAKAVGDAIENYRVPVDTTLTHQDEAADAKSTGDAIDDVVIASGTQPTSEFNQIWIDDEAEDEYTVPTYSEFSEVKNALNSEINQVAYEAYKAPSSALTSEESDLDVSDESGNVLVRLENGHIKTKEFDSSDIKTSDLTNDSGFITDENLEEAIDEIEEEMEQINYTVDTVPSNKLTSANSDLDISDELGNVIVRFTEGHIKTKEFDSADIKTSDLDNDSGFVTGEAIEDINYNIEVLPDNKSAISNSDLDVADENGNVIVRFEDGHIQTKNFDSSDIKASDLDNDLGFVGNNEIDEIRYDIDVLPMQKATSETSDLDLADENGNVIARFINGHIQTKNFDSSDIDPSLEGAVLTVNNIPPDEFGNVNVYAEIDPSDMAEAVSDYLDEHPVVASASGVVSVSDYNAVGDGITDDSAAIQNAVNSNYDVYFESNKTYYLASPVTIGHDIRLHGGLNTIIKTKTPDGDVVNDGIRVFGTLKTTTTLTSDYLSTGSETNPNCSNQLTLVDMENVEIGDLIFIQATDQFFSYSRRYYYLGGVFKVVDKYDGHIYINRNMPFDITLTNKVKAYIYDAPVAEVENLSFESDLDSFGTSTYNALLQFEYCKDSVVRQCTFNKMKVGFRTQHCVNTLIDGVQCSKSRWVNQTGLGDGYGIVINSCTNTTVRRVVALCSQGCIDMGGHVPAFDTYIKECHLASECRGIGLDMHDNSYNLVVEDCVMGGMSVFGTATISRCQFIKNNRVGGDAGGISFRGFHDPRWSRLHVMDCIFDTGVTNWLTAQVPQDWVQPIDSIIDRVVFEHCRGGRLFYNPSTNEYIQSNLLNELIINDWQECEEFFHSPTQHINTLIVKDSTFTLPKWLNCHSDSYRINENIDTAIIQTTNPKHDWMFINSDISGGAYTLNDDASINVSSQDVDALYIVCGENCASNIPDDYNIGSVGGSTGSAISKTVRDDLAYLLTVNNSGNLIFTQPSTGAGNFAVFPKCMLVAAEESIIRISCKIKNTGLTDGSSFRVFIAVINPETGLLTYRNNGSSGQATAEGVTLLHSHSVPKGHIAMAYIACYNAIADSETTIEDFSITLNPVVYPSSSYSQYNGNRRIGDGLISGVQGVNHIMSSADLFHVNINVGFERTI